MMTTRDLRRTSPLLFGLLMMLAWLAPPALAKPTVKDAASTTNAAKTAEAASAREDWSIILLNGAPAGYMREAMTHDGDIATMTITTSLRMRRGSIEIPIRTVVVYRETAAGELMEMTIRNTMSQQQTLVRYEFHKDGVDVTTRQGGRELNRTEPLPEGEWLTPAEAERFIKRRLEAGAKEIIYRAMLGEGGLNPVEFRLTRTGEDQAEVNGKTIPVTVWDTEMSLMPGVRGVTHYSSDGEPVFTEMNMGGLKMTTRLATEEEARQVGAAEAPELMVTLFIPIDQPIERPRQTKRAVYTVSAKQGGLPKLPSAGAQRVEMKDDGRSATVTVDLANPQPATEEEQADTVFTEPSLAVDGSDPLIRKLAARAVEGVAEDDLSARAEALRAFAYEHVTGKGLETAFATASETARHRTGDCSEHGVLLAALLRADGIPSRVATGVVYAGVIEGEKPVWGWHMWTQALIDGKWIDLDATLPVQYDAAHLLAGVAALSDGESMTDLNQMMALLGNLEIKVEKVAWE